MDLLSLSAWAMDTGRPWLGAAAVAVPATLALVSWRFHGLYLDALEEQQNCKDLIDNLSEGIYRSLPGGTQLSANRALVALNGYSSEAEQLEGVKDIAAEWYVEPGRRDEFRRILRENGRVENFVSEIYRHKTRERIWISESARLVRHRKTGEVLYYEGSVREITETLERLKLEERFQKLMRQVPGVLFQMELPHNGKARMAYMSPGIARITGYDEREHTARPGLFYGLVHPSDRAEYDRTVTEAAAKLSSWDVEFRIRAKDGTERWLHMTAMPEKTDDMLTWHGYVADVSVRKRQAIEIEELAFFDPLTKLPNRRAFMRHVAELAFRQNVVGALLFVDLDNFKSLNDTHGHDIGDAYLVKVAERLREAVGSGDTVARLGGDEFVVVAGTGLPNAAHARHHAITVANRIVAALREPFALGSVEHVGSASVGVACFDGQEHRADELLRRADIAMYQAKAAGRNGMALFDPTILHRETDRYLLLQELRAAIADDQFVLRFQPLFDHERGIVGTEALIHWRHPARGLLAPGAFAAQAEQFGLSADLARLTLEKGLAALGAWAAVPDAARLRLSLNIGAGCFATDGFLPFARNMLGRAAIEPGTLTFELTETVMAAGNVGVAARMREIKALGVRLSLDGFGTGYSSLSSLRELPFDEIKIDGKFVADIEGSDEGRAMVRTILAMARLLRLSTAAERVENIRQEAFLRAFGCDLFQGGLYAPALDEGDFLRFVTRHRAGETAVALPAAG